MMKTIEEKMVDYYNKEINKSGHPVTLEWLKRQRIVERRVYLELHYGKTCVDQILGEYSFLANAESMLSEISYASKYELLPDISCALYAECNAILDAENPVRKKYDCLKDTIPIIFYTSSLSDSGLSYLDILSPTTKQVSHEMFHKLYHSYAETFKENPCLAAFFQYLQKVAYYSLQTAFNEIRAEVEKTTK